MPGWDIFPFEIDSLRTEATPAVGRRGAAAGRGGPRRLLVRPATGPGRDEWRVWSNDRWQLHLDSAMRLPIGLSLGAHTSTATCRRSRPSSPREMGRLIVAVSAAVEALPSVGRVQVAKYGDGGAHLHLFFLARPARMLQLRGSPLLDWEENLPPVPVEVARANAEFVAERLRGRARRGRSRLAR